MFLFCPLSILFILLLFLCLLQLLCHHVLPLLLQLCLTLISRFLAFYTEEHWSQFSQPVGVDSSHTAHVLFGSHDKLMIDNVFRNIAKTKESTAHMKTAGYTSSHIDVIADALDFGGVDEIP